MPAVTGAVYDPSAKIMPPFASRRDHVTDVSEAPETDAENFLTPLSGTVGLPGVTWTETPVPPPPPPPHPNRQHKSESHTKGLLRITRPPLGRNAQGKAHELLQRSWTAYRGPQRYVLH